MSMKLSHKNIMNDVNIIGTCCNMCPTEEAVLRKKEKMVHVLEVTRAGYEMVKSFSRSAATSIMAVPRLLRPFSVLMETVDYLLLEVSSREDVKMSVMYDFLNDRLRAVRQDMTIQRLPPEECNVLLEPMIRFYIYYGYRLCDNPPNEFDLVLNKKYLLECLKWLLCCCDSLDAKTDIDTTINNFTSLNVNRESRLICDRTLIECLYILCNLDDVHPLYRYLRLTQKQKNSALVTAYNIAVANLHGNYIRIWKLAKRLCPLTYAALCLNLPTVQRRALIVLSHAYNNKQLTVPVKVVKNWLAFNSEEELRTICSHYGLKATDNVIFNKGDFKMNMDMPPPIKNYQAKILQMKLQDVLTYKMIKA